MKKTPGPLSNGLNLAFVSFSRREIRGPRCVSKGRLCRAIPCSQCAGVRLAFDTFLSLGNVCVL
jgi:hypothetical protein